MAGPAEPLYAGLFDLSAFCPLGPLVSPISEPTQISLRGDEPAEQVPLWALMSACSLHFWSL